MRTFCRYALLLCLSCLSVHLYAQNAAITGEVQDSSGAVVRGAEVRIVEQSQGITRSVHTNEAGNYNAPFLNPGPYRVYVQAPAFSTAVSDPIVLTVGQTLVFNVRLKVGSTQQEVTVNAGSQLLNTTDGSVSTVVDRQFVANMPLNGRSFQDLILLTPGATTNSPQQNGQNGDTGEFSVNGQRTESNVYTVDGVNANTGGYIYGEATPGTSGSLPAATAMGTTQSLASVEDLQEFRVNSSSYSAEYGLSPGGQFSFETRSGTNSLHGAAFDYLRNDALDANNWFNDNTIPTTSKPAERQNDFGGTVGGPVWIPKIYNGKNRSFFFFSYEGLRLTEPQAASITYVPSAALRDSAPAALQPLLNAFPIATGQPLSNGLAPFVAAYSAPSSLDSTSIRFDEQLTSRIRAFYRFSDTQSNVESRSVLALSMLSFTRQSNYTNTFGLTTFVSKAIANDFRLSYTSSTGSSLDSLDDFGGATPVNLLQLQSIDTATYPSASVGFGLFFPGYEPQLADQRASQPQYAWNVTDSTTFTTGRHTLKVGVDFRRISSHINAYTPYVFSAFDSSTGVLTNTSEYGLAEVTPVAYPAYSNFALYIQDELKANKRLNLSIGLRWEVNPPPTTTFGTLPYIAQGSLGDPADLTLAPQNTPFWKTTYFNFAPRLGVAYRAHGQPGHETILRAGGGVFFDSGQQASTSAFSNDLGASAYGLYYRAAYPLTPAQLAVSIANPPIAPYNAPVYYFPARLQLPYTLQWNTAIEQALGSSQSLTVSYVGSNGRRLLSQLYVYPDSEKFSEDGIILEGSGETSSYNALQVKFQRTLNHGLQLLASYNWAHSIDFGSQNLDYSPIRGNSDFDLRNNFNAALTYDVPKISGGAFVKTLASRWSLDGRFSVRTAFPVQLEGNYISTTTYSGYSSLNTVAGEPIYLHVDGLAGNREINPAAFSLPSGNDYGDAPRNFVRGFGMNQVDLAVRRSFPIFKQLNLQFRVEMFNLLNQPNFGYIEPLYGNPQFGQATETLNESLGNLSPLYQQGGPRSMQVSLRLQF